jgi:multiple sugar transport system permease protein
LPASANAVAIVIVKRFFDSIPRELFNAASVDGAGHLRVFVSIVLPSWRCWCRSPCSSSSSDRSCAG